LGKNSQFFFGFMISLDGVDLEIMPTNKIPPVRILAIVCLHCLPRLASFGKTGTGARRQGALAPQLLRATQSSEFQSEDCALYGVSIGSTGRFNLRFQVIALRWILCLSTRKKHVCFQKSAEQRINNK